MIRLIQQGRISDRVTEQIGDQEVKPRERVLEHTGDRSVDQIIDSPVAQIRGFNVEVWKATPEERLQVHS